MRPMVVQIWMWLMQPEVWRFVGFASAVVGLLCYALSSSFIHLFGDWNLLKIFLYSVISFIICLMILYTKVWQHSRSLRFKAHLAFLVLTITSVYSFFSDKVMNGKPDAYTLISCAAFAIMSLSLSRQTRCGFEVDLLYFFLGCLIVQLMKIKLQLGIVGAGFSYFLVILRSSFPSIHAAADYQYYGLQNEHSVVLEVDSLQLASNTDINIASMMQQLTTCVKALQHEDLNLMDRLLELVKKYREDEHRLLGKNELVGIDHDFAMDALSSEKINNLHETAKLMVGGGAGFKKELLDVYSSWRRGFLQECLFNKLFKLQEINIENGLEREDAGTIIRNWNIASKAALMILVPIERRLCDRVFSGFSNTAASCFTEVCQGAVFHLLNFADAVASGSPSAWRLFEMLPMFETLRDLIPQFQSLFPDSLVNEAITVKNRLGEASRDLFMELDTLIFRIPKAERVDPADGRLHPVTTNVMSDIASACRSRQTLEKILQEYPKVANGVGASSSFTAQIGRIMVLLEGKFIAKSKNYKDPALRYLSRMNNRSHIEAMNESWELGTVSGDDWFQKNKAKIQQDLDLYRSSSWNQVLDFLKLDNESVSSNDNMTAELFKDKLNLFNRHFEETCRVQSRWYVYGKKLREEIRTSLQNMLLPTYGVFIGRVLDFFGNQAYKYIVYGMFDVEDRLNHLFMGHEVNGIPRTWVSSRGGNMGLAQRAGLGHFLGPGPFGSGPFRLVKKGPKTDWPENRPG